MFYIFENTLDSSVLRDLNSKGLIKSKDNFGYFLYEDSEHFIEDVNKMFIIRYLSNFYYLVKQASTLSEVIALNGIVLTMATIDQETASKMLTMVRNIKLLSKK